MLKNSILAGAILIASLAAAVMGDPTTQPGGRYVIVVGQATQPTSQPTAAGSTTVPQDHAGAAAVIDATLKMLKDNPDLAAKILVNPSDAGQSPSTQPSVATVLDAMDTAYARLASAQFDGHITGDFDINGQQRKYDVAFTSSFTAPNKFRHETTGDLLIGSTGKNVYAYLGRRDEYQTIEAPKTRVTSGDWPSVVQTLSDQNPSLLLAISKSASAELKELSKQITVEESTNLDGVSYDTLRLDVGADHEIITMLIDSQSHLLRQVRMDQSGPIKKTGATDVKSARVIVDYTKVTPDAAVPAEQFAWTAPATAVQVSAAPVELADSGRADAFKELIGKPAPDFKLPGLDGQTLKLSSLKGSVVVLDFWATWCGPCVMSLPHLDDLYKKQSPNGLKVYALDQQEDKQKVAEFVKDKGWSLPVLLDDGSAAKLYKVTGIPQTVVIGKDGVIRKIFVGSGNEDNIATAVAKAMAE